MLGMVTEEPADFEPCVREGGVVPWRSGGHIGVANEVILRVTAWRHSQWHQVGSRGILRQRVSSALRKRATTGAIVVLEGGDLPRVVDLRDPLLPSSSIRRTIPGPPVRGRVERLHNGPVSYTHLRAHETRGKSRMPSSA